MKTLLWGFGIFIGVIFILWVIVAFPYPNCTTRQIEIMKQELIDGILVEKIQRQELYTDANGKEFVQTEAFKNQLQKEKEKFYKYCDNNGASKYKNDHCEITSSTHWDIFGRIPHRTLKYHFDQESQEFFNQIQTYMGYEKFSTNPTGNKKVWHDRFWLAEHTSQDDNLLYPVKVVGYSSDYNFEGCSDYTYGHLRGMQELELGSGEAIRRGDLIFKEAEPISYDSIVTNSRGEHKSVSFHNSKFYIQKEKK